MDFAVLEFEALPDIAGARQVFDLAPDLSDKNVAKVIFHHQQRTFDTAPFLAPHLRALVVVSLLVARDESVKRYCWSAENGDERAVLESLGHRLNRFGGDLVVWDAGRHTAPWLRVRAMINGCSVPFVDRFSRGEALFSDDGTGHNRVGLASRMGVACDPAYPDEHNWEQYEASGLTQLVQRCERNVGATAALWIAYCRATGRLPSEDHEMLADQIDRLFEPGDGTAAK